MTTLSLDKFQQFIQQYGFMSSRYFSMDKCIFIECCSITTGELFICQVPDNYTFMINTPSINIQLVNTDNSPEDDLQYYATQDESIIEQNYINEESHNIISTIHKVPIKEHLHSTYKHKILLKDIESNEKLIIKNIYRQCERLKYSVQGLQHKFMILKTPYIALLTQDDKIQIFKSDLPSSTKLDLRIVIDLKIFIDKIKNIDDEVTQLNKGVFNILNNNQKTHVRNIKKILERRENILQHSEYLFNVKNEFQNQIEKFSKLLVDTMKLEQDKELEIQHITTMNNENNIGQDLKYTHKKHNLTREHSKLQKIKFKILETLKSLREQQSHISLTIDTMLFNNIVMLDQIFKNFQQLENIKMKEN
jgi:hypothetical protein